ncbi:Peroxidase [Mycena chlorophos]|uniref:Peroxidase n=1 Tax=Mycena chlorophos TaxID=658473 RepID=A0A8H6TLC2_MYCCL|nr:Peroxidase [Mycena chlorophos]
MPQRSLIAFLSLASTLHIAVGDAVFNWPDPLLSTLDDSLYRPFVSAASTFALNCGSRDNSTIAAQWLRLAYHDAATYDITTGLGGLDASIAYEYTRPQNPGPGMLESLLDFAVSPNEYVGMADFIAMGAINAVIGCGGPVIPFRGGRVDATEAGPATVPEPQQDLATHTAKFAAQGFNATEMISLIACGHSLGGVRQVDFPLVVTEDVPTGIQTFTPPLVDNQTIGFDNTLIHEYLDGTTQDVLVVGSNITTRSDLRIFSSDNNVTMNQLADLNTFNEVCVDLIGRMINTVPSSVTLTDNIEPFDFKVWNTLLFPQGGSLAFLATLRIIENGLTRTVTMFWASRSDSGVSPAESSLLATLKGVPSFNLHSFNASIDLVSSISHFWFEVDNNDGSAPFVVDNNGKNYTIDQDVVLFDPRRSSFTIAGQFIVVGVKDPATDINVTALCTVSGSPPIPVPSNTVLQLKLDTAHPPADGYTFYTAPLPSTFLSNTVHATVNGTAYSEWVPLLSAPGV